VNSTKGAAPNLLLDDVLVDEVLRLAVVLAIGEF
jgi:hypothetical protein